MSGKSRYYLFKDARTNESLVVVVSETRDVLFAIGDTAVEISENDVKTLVNYLESRHVQ